MRLRRGSAVSLGAVLCLLSTGGRVLAHEPGVGYPSKWGAADEVGAANEIDADKVLEAAKLVKQGKRYSLAIETNSRTPAFPPRGFKVYVVQPGQVAGGTVSDKKGTYNDDILEGWMGVGTQIDGLGHVGIDNVYYNGNKARDFVTLTGLTKLGIEKVPPLVTRGVLLDMAAYFGVPLVSEGTVFNAEQIEGAARRQKVEIRKGDVVIFHTGWLSLIGKDDARFSAGEPGLGVRGARYLADKGVVAIGADNWALEVGPSEPGTSAFEVHQVLLAERGVYILENLRTEELARDKAYEFMFVLGAPRFTGAVQAVAHPIAIR